MSPAEWRRPYESLRIERVQARVVEVIAQARLELHKKMCPMCMIGMFCPESARLARRHQRASLQQIWWAMEPRRLGWRCSYCGQEGVAIYDCFECSYTKVECPRCLILNALKGTHADEDHRKQCRPDVPVYRRIATAIEADFRRYREGRA